VRAYHSNRNRLAAAIIANLEFSQRAAAVIAGNSSRPRIAGR